MHTHALTYDEVSTRTVADVVARLLEDGRPICIAGPGGVEIELRLVSDGSDLEPLETLAGSVPPNWKDAVYGPR
jgi:hypothetical protein